MVKKIVGPISSSSNVHDVVDDYNDLYRNMVMNAMRMNQGYTSQYPIIDEELKTNATKFFDLLKDYDEPLWDGCTNHSKLSVVEHVFTIKLDHSLSDTGYKKNY
jgi:hypothetical protein